MRNIIVKLITVAVFTLYGFSFQTLQSQNDLSVSWLTNSSGTNWDYLITTVIDSKGNIYAVGNFTGTMQIPDYDKKIEGENDIFIIQYGADGQVVWINTIKSKNSCSVSATCVDSAGYYYVSGYFSEEILVDETAIFSHGNNGAFVIKFDNGGHMEWYKAFEGNFSGEPISLFSDDMANLYIAGSFHEELLIDSLAVKGNYYSDIYILTLNDKGELIGSFVFKGNGDDIVNDIYINGNDIYIVGYFEKDLTLFDTTIVSFGRFDAFFMRFSPDTSKTLVRQAGSNFDDFGTSIILDKTNNILFAGSHSGKFRISNNDSLKSNGNLDVFICKFSNDGEIIWADNFGGRADDFLSNSGLGSNNDIYLTGNYRGTIKKGDYKIESNNFSEDIFLAKYTENGKLRYIQTIGDTTPELGKNLIHCKSGNLILSGNLYETDDLLEDKLDSINGHDFFIAYLYDCSLNSKISLPNDTSLCGERYTIIADTGYYNYSWNMLKGNNCYTIDTSGLYYVNAQDINGCISSDTIIIKLNVPPQVSIGDDLQLLKGEQINLRPELNYKAYLWSTNSKKKVITINMGELMAGEHWFNLIVTDTNDCSSNDELRVTIVETNLANDLSLLIYPNPVKDKLNYIINNINNSNDLNIAIVTQSGARVLTHKIRDRHSDYSNYLDVSSLMPGTYIFIVKNGDKTIEQLFTIL